MITQTEKAKAFKALHERDDAFVIPNPWDSGSARLLSGLEFEALATTSSGFAHSLGRLDGEVTLDEAIEHCRRLCASTHLPVSADLENCFADEPEKDGETILLAAHAAVVGCSIEDYTRNPSNPIYDFVDSRLSGNAKSRQLRVDDGYDLKQRDAKTVELSDAAQLFISRQARNNALR